MEDIIIRGGCVADGTGAPLFRADVAVTDGKITATGDLSHLQARRELSAQGLVVAPGFIDAHAHSDTSFLRDSSSASKLYQGITTEISGQCGSSPFPALPEKLRTDAPFRCLSFDEFVRKFESSDYAMAVNQALLMGHGSLRGGVMGYEDRAPTQEELSAMQYLLDRDLQSGAWGLSLGLEYSPGFFARPEELSALGRVVHKHHAIVTCHMRSEGRQIDEALDELLQVGRASGAHVHVSHIKLDHFTVHGRAKDVWAKIERARSEGLHVTADLYPFTASCTDLTIRCPKWSQEGGSDAVIRHLQGARRQEVIEGIRSHYFNAERAETCLFCDDNGCWPEIVGKTLRYVAEECLHTTDYAQAAAEVIIRTKGDATCIFFVMDEQDMLYFLSQDVGIGSDGWAMPGDPALVTSRPHPRSYAAITEFFRLAREHNLCTVEQAVRRVTSMAADMLGMTDRGRIAPGLTADITVFDPAVIAPRATYLDPVQLSEGIAHVLVNGQIALENGVQTAVRAGRFLRKTAT